MWSPVVTLLALELGIGTVGLDPLLQSLDLIIGRVVESEDPVVGSETSLVIFISLSALGSGLFSCNILLIITLLGEVDRLSANPLEPFIIALDALLVPRQAILGAFLLGVTSQIDDIVWSSIGPEITVTEALVLPSVTSVPVPKKRPVGGTGRVLTFFYFSCECEKK